MQFKRMISLCIVFVMMMGVFSGCSKEETSSEKEASTSEAGGKKEGTAKESEAKSDIVNIEVWNTNGGMQPIEPGTPYYDFIVEHTGVGVIHPYVEWDGGTNYLNQLNLKIAAGEMPDLFRAYGGIETELAANGGLADLSKFLPEYAPNVWNRIPQEAWDIVRANDPNGEGGIYWIPAIVDYARMGGLIRQDWLDKLGLDMPTTQEELVEVLKAFKEKDPNGNGIADELATGGRADARWMDNFFLMYGVAMFEGYPQWDEYDGELTFSAVTQNMKDAIAFCKYLYEEGLMDPETFLNSGQDWKAKISANRVGVYYHWMFSAGEYVKSIKENMNLEIDFTALPAIQAPGYEEDSFYLKETYQGPFYLVKSNEDNDEKLKATLQLLNAMYDPELLNTLTYGVEGMHHEMVDGKPQMLPEDKSVQQNKIINSANELSTLEERKKTVRKYLGDDKIADIVVRNLDFNQANAKVIAGAGLPQGIYADYPDIKNNTLYKEYVSKIIIGEYSIDKFDEFVEKWYAAGGEEVTKAAREWYEKKNK